MALNRVLPLDGPAYPAWVASVDADPVDILGLTTGNVTFSVKIHPLTGEIIEDPKEYRTDELDGSCCPFWEPSVVKYDVVR